MEIVKKGINYTLLTNAEGVDFDRPIYSVLNEIQDSDENNTYKLLTSFENLLCYIDNNSYSPVGYFVYYNTNENVYDIYVFEKVGNNFYHNKEYLYSYTLGANKIPCIEYNISPVIKLTEFGNILKVIEYNKSQNNYDIIEEQNKKEETLREELLKFFDCDQSKKKVIDNVFSIKFDTYNPNEYDLNKADYDCSGNENACYHIMVYDTRIASVYYIYSLKNEREEVFFEFGAIPNHNSYIDMFIKTITQN